MKIPFFNNRRTVLKRIVQFSALGLFAISTPFTGSLLQSSQAQTRPGINTKVVNLAYQTSGDIVKIKGAVEPRLKALGISVNWVPFPAGPQLLEAMNANRVDIGSVGETPPIFAQAAGAQLVYIAARKPSKGEGQAIVVQKDSPIKKVADLKGKRVVFQKGSSAHYLVLRALKEAGLKFSDIQPVSLTPSEARDAFLQRKIDAWAVWDPALAYVQKNAGARTIRNSARISTQGGFYVARRQFATENPEVVRVILEEIDKLGEWAESNTKEVAKILAPELKLEVSLLETVAQRRTFRLRKLSSSIITEQQRVADEYFDAKLLPRKLDVKEFLLPNKQYEALTPKRLK
ncbi:aliphatic sulfonate ABC transporter substrate-binding protein [Tolypothrix sp. PCC 7910]|uniref:aliphatic sulfonate ABC transporter substrate-binding protein n=1 Tax=Tolypothrix sp. PCC 7910 TaxID=2099387 RepID=UPI0014278488|nr:aliphatic sulfonate ABC transporter substrate-binding protein [Tolypothrix sp. PCC 7910]QIR35925.1 aliphatic sulfonate ABC transporter substrate-binding protein [Tolypothrix sp. PCC 7910]